MREPRGTVILCDQLYPSVGGKWVIAGTYTHCMVQTGHRQVDLPGLQVYLRFQVEREGEYGCELLLVNRALPSHAPAILRQDIRVHITDPLSPCEMGCVLPPFRVQCPDLPSQEPGARIGVPLLLWFKVAAEDVATCPLNIIFQPQRGQGHAGDPAERPEPGTGP